MEPEDRIEVRPDAIRPLIVNVAALYWLLRRDVRAWAGMTNR